MSYSQEEIDKLKGLLKDILAEDYFETLHESKKKLLISQQKQQRLKEKLDKDLADREIFAKCHECHKLSVVYHDAATQTLEIDPPQETPTSTEKRHKQTLDKPINCDTSMQTEASTSGKTLGFHQSNGAMTPKLTTAKKEVNPTPSKSIPEPELICIDSD